MAWEGIAVSAWDDEGKFAPYFLPPGRQAGDLAYVQHDDEGKFAPCYGAPARDVGSGRIRYSDEGDPQYAGYLRYPWDDFNRAGVGVGNPIGSDWNGNAWANFDIVANKLRLDPAGFGGGLIRWQGNSTFWQRQFMAVPAGKTLTVTLDLDAVIPANYREVLTMNFNAVWVGGGVGAYQARAFYSNLAPVNSFIRVGATQNNFGLIAAAVGQVKLEVTPLLIKFTAPGGLGAVQEVIALGASIDTWHQLEIDMLVSVGFGGGNHIQIDNVHTAFV